MKTYCKRTATDACKIGLNLLLLLLSSVLFTIFYCQLHRSLSRLMCFRRTSCKFRHITKEDEESEIKEMIQNNSNRMGLLPSLPLPTIGLNGNSKLLAAAATVGYLSRADPLLDDCDFGPPLAKRRFLPADLEYIENEAQKRRAFFKGYFAGNPPMLNGVDAK